MNLQARALERWSRIPKARAINRDQIINTILEGFASRLDGPIGPGQYGYDPNLKPKLNYDPEKAKKAGGAAQPIHGRRG